MLTTLQRMPPRKQARVQSQTQVAPTPAFEHRLIAKVLQLALKMSSRTPIFSEKTSTRTDRQRLLLAALMAIANALSQSATSILDSDQFITSVTLLAHLGMVDLAQLASKISHLGTVLSLIPAAAAMRWLFVWRQRAKGRQLAVERFCSSTLAPFVYAAQKRKRIMAIKHMDRERLQKQLAEFVRTKRSCAKDGIFAKWLASSRQHVRARQFGAANAAQRAFGSWRAQASSAKQRKECFLLTSSPVLARLEYFARWRVFARAAKHTHTLAARHKRSRWAVWAEVLSLQGRLWKMASLYKEVTLTRTSFERWRQAAAQWTRVDAQVQQHEAFQYKAQAVALWRAAVTTRTLVRKYWQVFRQKMAFVCSASNVSQAFYASKSMLCAWKTLKVAAMDVQRLSYMGDSLVVRRGLVKKEAAFGAWRSQASCILNAYAKTAAWRHGIDKIQLFRRWQEIAGIQRAARCIQHDRMQRQYLGLWRSALLQQKMCRIAKEQTFSAWKRALQTRRSQWRYLQRAAPVKRLPRSGVHPALVLLDALRRWRLRISQAKIAAMLAGEALQKAKLAALHQWRLGCVELRVASEYNDKDGLFRWVVDRAD